MLYKLSFIFLNLFVAASFFSPTLRFIFLVPGLLFWILAIIFFDWNKSKPVLEKFFSPLNLVFLFFVIVNFFLKACYEEGLALALKSFFGSYLQWFWIIFILEFYANKKLSADKVLSLTTLFSASVLSLVIIFQFMGLVPLNGEYLGILSQPFTSSGLLICSLFMTLSLLPVSSELFSSSVIVSRIRFGILALSALQVIAILFLGQLSAWFGLLLGLIIFILTSKVFSKKQILLISLIPLFLLAFAYNSAPRIKAKIDRLKSFQNLIENKSIKCRFEIWRINYLLWLEKPILGLKKIMPYDCVLSPLKPPTRMFHAHNIYLQNLFNGGIIRFTAWIILYLTLLFSLLKNRSSFTTPFLCGFLALSVEGFFENWWGDSEVLTLFFLMMLIFNSKEKISIQNLK